MKTKMKFETQNLTSRRRELKKQFSRQNFNINIKISLFGQHLRLYILYIYIYIYIYINLYIFIWVSPSSQRGCLINVAQNKEKNLFNVNQFFGQQCIV